MWSFAAGLARLIWHFSTVALLQSCIVYLHHTCNCAPCWNVCFFITAWSVQFLQKYDRSFCVKQGSCNLHPRPVWVFKRHVEILCKRKCDLKLAFLSFQNFDSTWKVLSPERAACSSMRPSLNLIFCLQAAFGHMLEMQQLSKLTKLISGITLDISLKIRCVSFPKMSLALH